MRVLSITAFVLGLIGLALVEWRARRADSKIPTVSDLCAFVMRYKVGRLPVGRIAVFGFWWWMGWHFLAR